MEASMQETATKPAETRSTTTAEDTLKRKSRDTGVISGGHLVARALKNEGVDTIRWPPEMTPVDRKSTRLNSSHTVISYAVFCLKKKNTSLSLLCGEDRKKNPLHT